MRAIFETHASDEHNYIMKGAIHTKEVKELIPRLWDKKNKLKISYFYDIVKGHHTP